MNCRCVLSASFFQRFGNQECQFQRLVGVEPWVAMGVVAVGEAGFADRAGAADAFGDVLAGHFDVDAAGIGAFGLVHLEELLHLTKNLREVAGLVAAGGLDGVAVHRIGTPQHLAPFIFHGTDQARQRPSSE